MGVILLVLALFSNNASALTTTELKVFNRADSGMNMDIVNTSVNKNQYIHVWAINFSPDGKYLAATTTDYRILIWNVSNGSLHKSINALNLMKIPDGFHGSFSLAFSKDNKLLAAGFEHGNIGIFNVASGTLNKKFVLDYYNKKVSKVSSEKIGDLRFIKDKLVVSSSRQQSIYKLPDLEHIGSYRTSFISIAYFKKNDVLNSINHRLEVEVVDIDTGKILKRFKRLRGSVKDGLSKTGLVVFHNRKKSGNGYSTQITFDSFESGTNYFKSDVYGSHISPEAFTNSDDSVVAVIGSQKNAGSDSLKIYDFNSKKLIYQTSISFKWAGRASLNMKGDTIAYLNDMNNVVLLKFR